ncbi:MAG: NAD-dependent epimerase/dehydratase [Saprospiraceae bacterium]|nr:NAD-dependent epimerase/dehydratase [Saprospiraceae bacterium]
MKVLITGGAGYIGYSLVSQLLEDVDHLHSITIYDNLSRQNYSFFTEARFDHKPVRFILGDILDGRSLERALQDVDCVVHLAAKVTTPFADHEAHQYDQVNHWGSAQVSRAIERSDVQKVIYLSSISVYGSRREAVDETIDPNPHSFYGISKLDGERQFGLLADSRQLYILRSGNVYGYNPSYRIDAVINRFMFNANFIGRIQINGSGDQYRSFIHVDKIAHCIVGAINDKYPPGLYNAVEHNLSINEVAAEVRTLYPGLDSIHVNYSLKLRDVRTAVPCRIFDHVALPEQSFHDELVAFKESFSF